jgi:hypothetical protein
MVARRTECMECKRRVIELERGTKKVAGVGRVGRDQEIPYVAHAPMNVLQTEPKPVYG